jgi:drug/metabolite transporter (DMT)-like permease
LITYVKLLMTMFFWGGTFVAGRLLAGVVPPFPAAFLRFVMASGLLLVLLRHYEGRFPPLDRRQLGSVVLLGLTGVLGYNVAFFTGLQTVTASRAGLIIALNPVGIALLSALFCGEPLRPLRGLGVLVSVTGAMLVISNGHLGLLTSGIGTGELYLLACVLCWALYSVVGKRAMHGLSPLTAVTYSALAGALFLAPVALTQGVLLEAFRYELKAWASLSYLAVFGTVIAFIWYYQAIREIGTVRSGVFINFVPIFSILLGFAVLDETLTFSLLQGAALVIIGAWLTNTGGRLRCSTEARSPRRLTEACGPEQSAQGAGPVDQAVDSPGDMQKTGGPRNGDQ